MYIYTYIYRERERERQKDTSQQIYPRFRTARAHEQILGFCPKLQMCQDQAFRCYAVVGLHQLTDEREGAR